MKTAHTIILYLTAFILTHAAVAQEIEIGQRVPDMTFSHILNYSSTTLKLSSFKNKLVILDFWNTGCAACLHGFRDIDSLQNVFKDSLQFFMVNRETEDSTRRFFKMHSRLKLPGVPFITQDKVLHRSFPQQGYPYQVWINGQGTVTAITAATNATPENIRAALAGKELSVSEMITVFDYDNSKPYIAEGNGRWLDRVKYCSYIMNPSMLNAGVDKWSGSYGPADEQNEFRNRIIFQGMDLTHLYAYAYAENKYDFNHANCIVYEVKDLNKYTRPADKNLWDSWQKDNIYTYDLMVPEDKIDKRYKYMQQDMERFFDAKGIIEKRMVKCWVLKSTGNLDKIKTKGGVFNIDHIKTPEGDSVIYQNAPFKNFTWMLKSWFSANYTPLPFVDATGYDGNIDISYLNIDYYGDNSSSIYIDRLKKVLNRFNLDLVAEDCLTEVLIIKEDD